MRFTKLPDSVIADIAGRMDYFDVCNLMLTSKRMYIAIKSYKKDKIKLKTLNFTNDGSWCLNGADHSDKYYRYKGWNHKDENLLNVERVLQTCESVGSLNFPVSFETKDYTWYDMFMKTKAKIGLMNIYTHRNIDIEKMFNVDRKFRASFKFRFADNAVLSDEFLTKLLPRSTVCMPYGACPLGFVQRWFPITDNTLNALVAGNQRKFSIHGMPNSITIEGIVRTFKAYREKYGDYLKPRDVNPTLHWDFGLLHPNQTADVEKYFGESGELRGICKSVSSEFMGHTFQYGILGDGFYIVFALARVDLV